VLVRKCQGLCGGFLWPGRMFWSFMPGTIAKALADYWISLLPRELLGAMAQLLFGPPKFWDG
jgi:hypothetical protein